MGLQFGIDGATRLADGVWRARLSPSDVRMLGAKSESVGTVTVVFVSEQLRFDAETSHLAFDPSRAKLLNAGTSDTAIFIGASHNSQDATVRNDQLATVSSGDSKYLSSLPPHLYELGEQILRAVRAKYHGDLVYYAKSGRYVEAPDNFWTVRPQPRVESFRITVRGRPESFQPSNTLRIRPDMGSYSSFTIERADQVEEFIRVLDQVRRK